MKVTDTQKDVCNVLIRTICWWRDSNDITSPTHLSDIEDCLRADFKGQLSEHETEILIEKISGLYLFIKYLSD